MWAVFFYLPIMPIKAKTYLSYLIFSLLITTSVTALSPGYADAVDLKNNLQNTNRQDQAKDANDVFAQPRI